VVYGAAMPRKGVWEPLPLIAYGYAIHPLSTDAENRKSRPNGVHSADTDNHDSLASRDIVQLEVGDNVYAFEQYTPKAKETSGIWYRGYVHARSVADHLFTAITQLCRLQESSDAPSYCR
jgi:dedicator of cytokinesis protein 3